MAMVSISFCSVGVIILSIASLMYNAASAPLENPLTGAAHSPPWWQNYEATTRYLQNCGLPSSGTVAFLSSVVPGTTTGEPFKSCYDQQMGQIRPICLVFASRVQSLCPAYRSKLSDMPEFKEAMESAFMNYEQQKSDPLSLCTDIKPDPEGLNGIGNAFENFNCASECGDPRITLICRSYAFLSTVAGQMLISSAGGEQNQQDGVDDKDAGLAEEQAAAGQATDERAGVSVKSPAETLQEGTDNQAEGNNPYGDQLAVSELKDSQGQNPGGVSPGDQGAFAAPAADGTKQETQQPSGVGENTDQGATTRLQGDAAAGGGGDGVGMVSERQGVNQGTYQGYHTPPGQGGTPARGMGADDTRQPTNPDSNPVVSQNQGTPGAQGGSPTGGHTVSGGVNAGDTGLPTNVEPNPAASPNQPPLDRLGGSQTGVFGPAGAGETTYQRTDQELQNDRYQPNGPSDVQGGSRTGGLTAPEHADAGPAAEIPSNGLSGMNALGSLPGTNPQDGRYNSQTAWQNRPLISENTGGTGDGHTIIEVTDPRLQGGTVGGQGQNGPYDSEAAGQGVSNQQTVNGQNVGHTGDAVPYNGAAGGETGVYVGQPDGPPGTNQQVNLGPDAGGSRQEETQNGEHGDQLLPEGDLPDSQGGNQPGIQQNVESGVGGDQQEGHQEEEGDQQEGHQEEEGESRGDDQAVGENSDNADNQPEERLRPEDDYSESDYRLPHGGDDRQLSEGDASVYDGDNLENDRDYQGEDESFREDDRQREDENANQESHQQVHEQVHKDIVYEEDEESSHFLAYSLTAIILILATYIMYHNKQKIIAVVVEGRNGKGRRRRQGYQKLDQNISEAMPSLQTA
ncbi:uncharacterized protein [Diadema antillarum]|uniref:uncharacterized protein n=1 Tax=Diadema antillarum TaxID=105358 RepID=UPI003A8953B8